MDFSIEIAKVLARRSCKDCHGRGYQTVNWCGEKTPIINPYKVIKIKEKKDKDVGEKFKKRTYYETKKYKVPVLGTKAAMEYKTWCSCAQRKVDKINRETKQ